MDEGSAPRGRATTSTHLKDGCEISLNLKSDRIGTLRKLVTYTRPIPLSSTCR